MLPPELDGWEAVLEGGPAVNGANGIISFTACDGKQTPGQVRCTRDSSGPAPVGGGERITFSLAGLRGVTPGTSGPFGVRVVDSNSLAVRNAAEQAAGTEVLIGDARACPIRCHSRPQCDSTVVRFATGFPRVEYVTHFVSLQGLRFAAIDNIGAPRAYCAETASMC